MITPPPRYLNAPSPNLAPRTCRCESGKSHLFPTRSIAMPAFFFAASLARCSGSLKYRLSSYIRRGKRRGKNRFGAIGLLRVHLSVVSNGVICTARTFMHAQHSDICVVIPMSRAGRERFMSGAFRAEISVVSQLPEN